MSQGLLWVQDGVSSRGGRGRGLGCAAGLQLHNRGGGGLQRVAAGARLQQPGQCGPEEGGAAGGRAGRSQHRGLGQRPLHRSQVGLVTAGLSIMMPLFRAHLKRVRREGAEEEAAAEDDILEVEMDYSDLETE